MNKVRKRTYVYIAAIAAFAWYGMKPTQYHQHRLDQISINTQR